MSKIQIIKNLHIPSCKNCIHYKPKFNIYFTSFDNQCTKFGTKDIISDKIIYYSPDICRNDNLKCGEEGKYFEKEPNLNLKMFKHFCVYSIPCVTHISAWVAITISSTTGMIYILSKLLL